MEIEIAKEPGSGELREMKLKLKLIEIQIGNKRSRGGWILMKIKLRRTELDKGVDIGRQLLRKLVWKNEKSNRIELDMPRKSRPRRDHSGNNDSDEAEDSEDDAGEREAEQQRVRGRLFNLDPSIYLEIGDCDVCTVQTL